MKNRKTLDKNPKKPKCEICLKETNELAEYKNKWACKSCCPNYYFGDSRNTKPFIRIEKVIRREVTKSQKGGRN